jgi:FAD/FMN-containing dehydrogenase
VPYLLNLVGRWRDPAESPEQTAWVRGLWQAVQPFEAGTAYVNFMPGDEGDRVRAAYGPSYDRLTAVKRRYDPDNLFRLNQNILPG